MTKGNARTRHRESAPSGSHRLKPVSVSTLHHYLMRSVEAYSHSLLVDTANLFTRGVATTDAEGKSNCTKTFSVISVLLYHVKDSFSLEQMVLNCYNSFIMEDDLSVRVKLIIINKLDWAIK